MPQPIPFLDLPQQHRPLLPELNEVVGRLIAEARFIGGPPVAEFEKLFAASCQAQGCVGVANGTDALALALRVLGIGPGDVVIVPAHTFIATAEAVTMVGATPRFVDVDPVTYTLDPAALDTVDASGVKAVMPVHLYGQPASVDPILAKAREHGWLVVEDVAQAHGATYRGKSVGSFGDLAGFSFYPGKNLGAFGDGGAVVGTDEQLLDRVRRFGDHGRQTKQLHGEPGINSRLDSIQAAVLTVKLRHLADWNTNRGRAAALYEERLAGIDGVVTPRVGPERTHVFHLYVVQVPDRDRLAAALAEQGIGTGVHYATPLHLQPAYASLGYGEGDFPVAEQVTGHCLSLPMFPDLSEEQIDRVAGAIRGHLKAGS